jgi:WD40 repeat protein
LLSVKTGEAGVVSNTRSDAAFSPDGKLLAITTTEEIKLVDSHTGAVLRSFEDRSKEFRHTKFSPSGKYLAFKSGSTAYLWDTATGATYATLRDVHCFGEFSPDDEYFAILEERGKIRLFATSMPTTDLDFGSDLKFEGNFWQHAMKFAPNGKIFATTTSDSQIQLWNIESGAMTYMLEGYDSRYLVFSSSGLHLASSSYDEVKVSDVMRGTMIVSLSNVGNGPLSTFSPTGKMLATADRNGTIKLWDIGSCQLKSAFSWEREPETFVLL